MCEQSTRTLKKRKFEEQLEVEKYKQRFKNKIETVSHVVLKVLNIHEPKAE